MKARKVKGLDPDMPFGDALARVLRVRSGELHSFGTEVLDPAAVDALHDMRIAAKRLRYVLELAEPCFDGASNPLQQLKELQELLGELHDCDVMLPDLRRFLDGLRAEDAAEARAAAGDAADLDPSLLRSAPNRGRLRGLTMLITYYEARRELLYGRFLERWTDLVEGDLHRRVQAVTQAAARVR